MQKLFDKFDKVFCINLPHRTDRRESFISEVNKYDLGNFEFFDAYYGQKLPNPHNILPGNVGLIKTNIEILKKAIDDNLNNIVIIEDDCVFTDEILNIDSYFEKLPEKWDMLYFGGNHNYHWHGVPNPIIVNEKVLKLVHSFTTHFIIINKNMFSVLIEKLSSYSHPIDVIYAEIQKNYDVYSFYPSIAKQSTGYSDIENREINYDFLIK
jgi:glycosyl transferase family 25